MVCVSFLVLYELANLHEKDVIQTQSAPNQSSQPLAQPSKEEPSFGDSSGPLFSIYTNVTEDEDNKRVKSWNEDADGILIFVSSCVRVSIISCTNRNTRLVYSPLPSLVSLP